MEKKYSEMIRTSAKGSLILIFGQVISTLISALGTIIIARMIGSTSFGIISVAQIPISIGLLFINFSVTNAITNFIAANRHIGKEQELGSIVLAGFFINLSIGVFVSLTLFLLSGYISNLFFQRPEIEPLVKILSLSIFATSLVNTVYSVLVGFERMNQRNILSIIYSLLKTVIGPVLVYIGFGVVGVAYGISIPYLISGLLGCVLVYINLRHTPPVSIEYVRKYLGQIFFYSYPIFFSQILSGGINQFFNLLLPLYVTDFLIGNYNAAATFSVLVLFLITPVRTATFPLLSKLKPSDDIFEFVFQSIIKYEALLVFPIAFLTIALSDSIVLVLYGPTYTATPQFLRLLMANFFFVGLGSQLSVSLLNSQKETKVNLYSALINLVIGVPLGLFLIPRFGVLGYQIALILAPKSGLLYRLLWIKRNYNLSPNYSVFFKTLISAFSSYLLCIIFNHFFSLLTWIKLFVNSILYFSSYMVFILLIGALSRDNLNDIYNLVTRNKKIEYIIRPFYKILLGISR